MSAGIFLGIAKKNRLWGCVSITCSGEKSKIASILFAYLQLFAHCYAIADHLQYVHTRLKA